MLFSLCLLLTSNTFSKHDAKKFSYVFRLVITARVRMRLMAAKQIMVY